ncbi:glycosyltransferase family 4 protein [Pontibacter mangrovi]|uniref:Undecaprenyl/decaprenyl-phosphate alpha-N-acetylglucosaminyl 1-phosphate transferase n=1 Tax=Pontibacter mangrovi TaxID=2589816 RepID=A0A501VS06_9BACT|nr:MraY family glycosyltransferase [Pontibacter mangrovi]TPE39978.1 undecaprenyl/decaprenyl-phosphate alpha-N-acetylglucosaminyl 1-phosphate transferase [Pontibacter mangrovi]
MIQIFTFFLTAFIITYFAVPSVIKVASLRNLFDEPNERKLHHQTIPALGGVAIFAGIFFSVLFWAEGFNFSLLRWIVLSLVIIFLLGLKDDIVAIDPLKKLVGLLVASGLVIVYGDLRIHSFYGLLGLNELPYVISVLFTLFVFVVIINAVNLIDGINGLAGGVGTIASAAFGALFLYNGNVNAAAIAFATAGALLAFLRYNFAKAKIFMGDGGALVIGFVLSVLCVRFLNAELIIEPISLQPISTPLVALAILIIPLVDTLRVFTIRILQKRSPFSADRNHIHHMLLDLGYSHRRSAVILYAANLYFILLTLVSQELGQHVVLFLIVVTAFVFCQLPVLMLRSKNGALEKQLA